MRRQERLVENKELLQDGILLTRGDGGSIALHPLLHGPHSIYNGDWKDQ